MKSRWFLWYWETPESERGVTIGASAVFPNKRDEVGVNVSLSPKKWDVKPDLRYV